MTELNQYSRVRNMTLNDTKVLTGNIRQDCYRFLNFKNFAVPTAANVTESSAMKVRM